MKFIYIILLLWYAICVFDQKMRLFCASKGTVMAYLDDNNENLYTQGDPLENLDKELAELQASLDELYGMTDNYTEEALSETNNRLRSPRRRQAADFSR